MYLFELELSSFPGICPGVGLVDHMVTLFLVVVFFKGAYVLFSIVAAPIYLPSSVGRFPFLYSLSSIYGHSDQYEEINFPCFQNNMLGSLPWIDAYKHCSLAFECGL